MRLLADFLERIGMPVSVDAIRREHVEAFVADLLTRNKPATASNRYRALKVFFRWLAEEGEIVESPMRNMKPPIIPETPVPVLSDDEIKRLLKACEGEEFADRRDLAILRLFIDSGLRRAELAHLEVSDVDLDQSVVVVLGKGRADSARARSDTRPRSRSTATSEPGDCTRWRTSMLSGSASESR